MNANANVYHDTIPCGGRWSDRYWFAIWHCSLAGPPSVDASTRVAVIDTLIK